MATNSIKDNRRKSIGSKEKVSKSNKMTRFDGRIPEEQKNLFLKAAMITGKTTSDFVFQAAVEKAILVLQEKEKILASERDKELFFDALMNPPKPNEALRKAVAKVKKSALA